MKRKESEGECEDKEVPKKAPICRSVTPYLMCDGTKKALDWYKKVFNARIGDVVTNKEKPDQVMHSTFYIGEDPIFAADDFKGELREADKAGRPRLASSSLYVYFANVDEVWKRAIDAGAVEIMKLEDQFWGDRYGFLRDPFGHFWGVAQNLRPHGSDKGEKAKADCDQAGQECEKSSASCDKEACEPGKRAKVQKD